ncbi:MAG: DUF2399 domain-containing protein [Actinomycetia bacterium]|nr:DUF2399 domain-containing protein [Actinomycetes bacterium]
MVNNADSTGVKALREPGFDRLWERARIALERSGHSLESTISVSRLTDVERRTLAGLMGRVPGRDVRVDLGWLDGRLREAVGVGLVEWLESIGPPLRDLRARRDERSAALDGQRESVSSHVVGSEPWISEWFGALERDGLLARMVSEGSSRDLQIALDVVASLREGRPRPLPVVAAEVTGDTKSLSGTRIAGLVERALCLWLGGEAPATSFERRALWARAGVRFDDVSSTILGLNVWSPGVSVLTLRQLVSSPHVEVDAETVFVCENPAVLMVAADELGDLSAPLLCTSGVPSDAFWEVLGTARLRGRLAVRADFDPAGLTIVASIIDRADANPWRFGTGDYLRALDDCGDLGLPLIDGEVPPTPWDPGLSSTMAASAQIVYEELMVDRLVSDLRR